MLDRDTVNDRNHEVFTKFFLARQGWAEEYCQSDDYLSEYTSMVKEDGSALTSLYDIMFREMMLICCNKEARNAVVQSVFKRLCDNMLFTAKADSPYRSQGAYEVMSLSDDEHEDQIEVKTFIEELSDSLLIPEGEDVISLFVEWAGSHHNSFCLHGVDTEEELRREHATFEMYTYVNNKVAVTIDGGRDTLQETLVEVICRECHERDFRRAVKLGILVWDAEKRSYQVDESKRHPLRWCM